MILSNAWSLMWTMSRWHLYMPGLGTSNNAVTPVEITGTIPVQILSRGTCFLFVAVLVEFRTGTLTVGEWACPGIRGPSYIFPKAQIVQSLVY